MTQVLVVGTGLAGLSATMFLAQRGIDVLAVDKHPGTSVHPRAAGQNPRTMELLRLAGVHEQVLAAGASAGPLQIKIARSARGEVLHTIVHGDEAELMSPLSPMPMAMASQVSVEPIMLAKAREHGADVRYETELVSFEQDADGVSARLLHRPTGRVEQVRADYLVAADGPRSSIREALGIARHGKGSLCHHAGMIFDSEGPELADLTGLYYLQHPEFTGAFGRTDLPNRFVFTVEYDPSAGESIVDFTPRRCTELIRAGLDAPDLEPELVTVLSWEMAALVAERFRDGRVFLAGDAAKVTPPTGGMGGNTAIGDGYDLAWKLAAVLRGEAGPGLLDSYEPERRRVADLVVAESLHNYVARMAPQLRDESIPESVGWAEVMFGVRHRSPAVLAADEDPAPVEDPLNPSGRPGFRAPHVRLLRNGTELSTVDLFGRGWVLLTGEEGGVWHEAAKHVADRLGIALTAHGLGPDLVDPEGGLALRYGIRNGGASLVRPDGVIAWRADYEVADATGALHQALCSLLDRAA
ncbi:FAD-dependent monooxygenase [Kutzneria viridogrisea]|uniref:Aklavinone 12-hydroxylase n=1 Tax=Kutzneria viridogrisea TaxID=47990 RepID=A0ABR6BHN6_9PSEU|nr:aklavinone 12-hydroxylase [Kutzneria viridogrisea]